MNNADRSDTPSSTPKFREGDVVRCNPRLPEDARSFEAIVVAGEDIDGVVLVKGHGRWGATALDLLRRPVREGDRIRSVNGVVTSYIVRADEAGEVDHHDWTHADGTPIEPPQAKAVDWEKRVVETAVNAMAARGQNLGAQQAAQLQNVGREMDQLAGQCQNANARIQGLGLFQGAAQAARFLAEPIPPAVWAEERAAADEQLAQIRRLYDCERRHSAELADKLQPLQDERDALQRRCDALELRLRRAGLTPPEGNGR